MSNLTEGTDELLKEFNELGNTPAKIVDLIIPESDSNIKLEILRARIQERLKVLKEDLEWINNNRFALGGESNRERIIEGRIKEISSSIEKLERVK